MSVSENNTTSPNKRKSFPKSIKIGRGVRVSTRRKPKSLLEAIDNVNMELSDLVQDIDKNQDYVDLSLVDGNNIDYLAKRMNLTPLQAVLFSICVEIGSSNIDYNDLARELRLSKPKALRLIEPLNELVRCRLLSLTNSYKSNTSAYSIPGRVLKALVSNQDYEAPQRKCEDTQGLLNYMHAFYNELSDEGIKQGLLIEEVEDLFNENLGIDFVKKTKRLYSEDRLLLWRFCDLLVFHGKRNVEFWDIEKIYPNKSDLFNIKTEMQSGEHVLMIHGFIEHACQDGIIDPRSFSLTEKARKDLLSSIKLNVKEEKLSGVIASVKIAAKELYFSDKVGKQVGKLQGFLDPEKYNVLVERMKERYNRCGLTCLMYGGPGTGKTETVYQLARQTGRDIMAIEVPQIKSKWVGDSEKNIKAVFDKYREMVEKAQVAPILLFNEADAIIGVRKSGAENAVDKMENSIQNIILQEMENLNGIMIATTNLTENLDSAFERRFLYKIEFERPDAGVREHIWQDMIPELDSEECKVLAEGFDFSGGQIENVARKFAIDGILGEFEQGDRLTELTTLCSEERINDSMADRRRIGFVA